MATVTMTVEMDNSTTMTMSTTMMVTMPKGISLKMTLTMTSEPERPAMSKKREKSESRLLFTMCETRERMRPTMIPQRSATIGGDSNENVVEGVGTALSHAVEAFASHRLAMCVDAGTSKTVPKINPSQIASLLTLFYAFSECPHGWCYTTMGVLLGIGGLVMCSFFIISCDVERIVILYNGVKPPNAPRIGYGFISRGTTFEEAPSYMSCISYTDQEKAGLFDAWMHAARFFLFLSTAFGVIGFVVLFTAICVAWSPNTFEHWLMWNYVFAALAIPMSYMLFGSPLCADNECKLGQGGIQCISIFLFWLTCANTVKSFPTASPPDEYGGGEGEDNDDLYYETEEDMWNDRRPPPPPMDEEEEPEPQRLMLGGSDPYVNDPEYGEDYYHGDGADGYANPDNYDHRNGSERPAPFMEEVPDTDYLDSSAPSHNQGAYPQQGQHPTGSQPYAGVGQGTNKYEDNRMYDDENGPAYADSQQVSRPVVTPRVGDEDGPAFT